MWSVIGTLVTGILPLLIKLVLYFIDKKTNNDKLKEEFLKFIASLDTDLPITLHNKYNDQLERIRKQLAESGK